MDIWNRTFLGNTVEDFAWFISIIILGLLFQRFISTILTKFIFRFLKKYSTGVGFDSLLELLKKPLGIFILLITFYLAFQHLNFPAEWQLEQKDKFGLRMFASKLYQVAIVLAFTWIVLRIVDFFGLIFIYRASLTESKSDDQLVPFVKEFVKILVFIFSIFFILGTVFDLNITSLVAGLGIGGLAIALAAKESLENLLGSFTIFLDKPFVIGDLVQIGNTVGNVEKIGFRSTRLRTLDKTFVTVPNKKMVEAELDNLTLRTFRRAKFFIGLTYNTSPEKIKAIVADIKNYLDIHTETTEENSVNFYEISASSLNIMVQYFVNTMDWNVYVRVREEINFEIMSIIHRHEVKFAYPTTSVYLENAELNSKFKV